MLQILYVILPIFIIIFGSALLKRFKVADDTWMPVLNNFALKIGFPALIFGALYNTKFDFTTDGTLILINSALIIITLALAYLIGKIAQLKPKSLKTLFICVVFGNVAYLGVPVLNKVYGEASLSEASIIIAVYLFWMFTLGIGFLEMSKKNQEHKDLLKMLFHKILTNPLLLAVIFGVAFSVLTIPLPDVIMQAVSMLSASVTPVVLVVIGLFLGDAKLGKLADWTPILGFSIVTLLLVPALMLLTLYAMRLDFPTYATSIVEASMPLAITPFALSAQYDLDKKFIANAIVLSTVLSIFTIPLWTSLI